MVVNDVESAAAAGEVRTIIEGRGGACLVKGFDVSDRTAVSRAIDEVTAAVGPISVLVNNAAAARVGLQPIWKMHDEDWDRAVATNLTGVYNCTKPVVKTMLERKLPRGRIITIGSAFLDPCSATTSGLVGFTKSLARALAPWNITVTFVAPGLIDTEATASLLDESARSSIPLGRVGRPEEVAAAVSFLASDRAAYITGEVISIDGGMHM